MNRGGGTIEWLFFMYFFFFFINWYYLKKQSGLPYEYILINKLSVWLYGRMYCRKKVCFVWITIMVFAVAENVTSRIGALFVSSSDTMLVSIGQTHCPLQHCAKLSISLVGGIIPNWWCTRICGYNKKKGLSKRCQSTNTLLDETAIFMATHLQNIITWQS